LEEIMERTKGKKDKATDIDGKIQWRKLGGGSFKLGSKIIKPNQVFLARPEEIPSAFRDTVVPTDGSTEIPKKEEILPKVESATKFEVRERAIGWYDVINAVTEQVMNESALRHGEAVELKESLS